MSTVLLAFAIGYVLGMVLPVWVVAAWIKRKVS